MDTRRLGNSVAMSAAADPVGTSERCCAFEHWPRRCLGHVEECTSCHWQGGGNWPGAPCVKCAGVVVRRPCKRFPTPGSTVCKWHGAAPARVRRAGRRRLAIAKADARLRDLEYEPVTDPIGDLADLAGQEKALVEWAAARVEELQNEISYTDDDDVEQLRVAVGVFERAMDRAARRLTDLARLGLEERRVQLEEAQAELVVAALRLAVERAGLPPAQGSQVIDAWSVAVVELEKANAVPPK